MGAHGILGLVYKVQKVNGSSFFGVWLTRVFSSSLLLFYLLCVLLRKGLLECEGVSECVGVRDQEGKALHYLLFSLLLSSLLFSFLTRARLWWMELGDGGGLRMLELASRIVELLECAREEATRIGIKVSSLHS